MSPAPAPLRAPRSKPARERHLAVVDPAARRRERRARFGVRVAVAAVIGAILLVVGFHVMMAEGQLQLDRINQATGQAQQRYERLRLEYSQRATPDAIVERAIRMGMVRATTQRYVSAPGLAASNPTRAGAGATDSSLARDWEKVKKHLVDQP